MAAEYDRGKDKYIELLSTMKLPENQRLKSPAPNDRDLPVLAEFLDVEMVRSIFKDHFDKIGVALSGCRISYIRYKPRTNCIIVYQLKLDTKLPFVGDEIPAYIKLYTAKEYNTAREKACLHRWANFCGTGEYLLLPDRLAIIYFFPNDTLIDGLRIVENPKKVQRILYQNYSKYPPGKWRISDRKLDFEIMRYKPERRTVIRFDTKAVRHDGSRKDWISVFARIYADDSGQQVYDLQRKLYQLSLKDRHFNIANPIVYLPDRRIFLMEKLEGKTLLDSLKDGDKDALRTAARTLATMHNIKLNNLPEFEPSSLVEKTRATFEMISEITPEFSGTAGRIHEALSKKVAEHTIGNKAFVHGDFYPGQVIIHDNVAGIIDFDRSCNGDPIADIGNFIAHLKLLRIKDIIANEAFESIFISSYEKARGFMLDTGVVNLWTAFSLYQLAVNPFRGLEPGWRANTELILNECQTLLP